MITYIEFHKKISGTRVSQYVYTSTTVESLFEFAIKVKFFFMSQALLSKIVSIYFLYFLYF